MCCLLDRFVCVLKVNSLPVHISWHFLIKLLTIMEKVKRVWFNKILSSGEACNKEIFVGKVWILSNVVLEFFFQFRICTQGRPSELKSNSATSKLWIFLTRLQDYYYTTRLRDQKINQCHGTWDWLDGRQWVLLFDTHNIWCTYF